MMLSAVAVMVALAGSWWGHLLLAGAGITMSPIFFYEYQWTLIQILSTMLVVAIPMAILGNFWELSLEHE